jgi:hypothetical protein
MGRPPNFEKRVVIIRESDKTGLERIRQHTLAKMAGHEESSPRYSEWRGFVAEIEAEQHRRMAAKIGEAPDA